MTVTGLRTGVALTVMVFLVSVLGFQQGAPTSQPRIAAGAGHSVALGADGSIWAWGNNTASQLGDGTTTARLTPTLVVGAVGTFTAVSAGGTHSLARRADGLVLAWGLNVNGEVGDGSTTRRSSPVQVGGLSTVHSVTAGGNHSLALRADGSVAAWGLNSEGQLGDNTTTRRLLPVSVPNLSDVVAIAGGGLHSIALRSDGTVWTWGANASGQLGIGVNHASAPAHAGRWTERRRRRGGRRRA